MERRRRRGTREGDGEVGAERGRGRVQARLRHGGRRAQTCCFDIVDHLTHTQMDKKWNSIHGKTFFENANVPRLIKVELPKKSRLSFGR